MRNVIEHAFIIESTEWINSSSFPKALQNTDLSNEEEAVLLETKIDYETLKSSVLDDGDTSEDNKALYSFDFPGVDNLNFNLAKESFEKAFIENALKCHKGKLIKLQLRHIYPKKHC